jgi:hypothetical protein
VLGDRSSVIYSTNYISKEILLPRNDDGDHVNDEVLNNLTERLGRKMTIPSGILSYV